jgi:hypothetical protein
LATIFVSTAQTGNAERHFCLKKIIEWVELTVRIQKPHWSIRKLEWGNRKERKEVLMDNGQYQLLALNGILWLGIQFSME